MGLTLVEISTIKIIISELSKKKFIVESIGGFIFFPQNKFSDLYKILEMEH